MKHIISLFALVLLSIILTAQPEPPSDLEGSELRTWLKTNWYDSYHTSLGYDDARRQMYGYIDETGGIIYCVYTGFSQEAGYVTYPNPINCEHTVPQSFFVEGTEPMKSDIFHLYPTHGSVNSARSNYPFGDIAMNNVTHWYTVNSDNTGIISTTSTPTSNLEEYSRLLSGTMFEVREDHKGSAARAVFYFYTMYPTQAGDISAMGEIDVLYQWHKNDPPNDWEKRRNNRIENVQGNRNPYIDYPEILARAWNIETVSTQNILAEQEPLVYPNPSQGIYYININSEYLLTVSDITGKIILSKTVNETQNSFDISGYQSGLYFISLKGNEKVINSKILKG